eukprot:6310209-Ditylum_brightwellii.AAC.1
MTCPLDLDMTRTQFWISQREIKTILCKPAEKCQEANRMLSKIPALTGNTTAAKALKSIQNTEYMSKARKKIGHVDKKKDKGSI